MQQQVEQDNNGSNEEDDGAAGAGLNSLSGGGESTPGFRREGERPLDLSRPLELARSLGVNFAAAVASSHFDSDNSFATATATSNDENLDAFAKNADEKMNDKMYNMDSLLSDDEYYHMDVPEGDENEVGNCYESNPTSPASSTTGGASGGGSNKQSSSNSTTSSSNKRFRTQMSSTQVKLMKHVFVDYKTPTMAECEMFGREIQLPKRVIQVWFQNARAKGKKAKIALMKIIGQEPEPPKPPSECKVCGFEYDNKYSIQDHIFTRAHIDNMRAYIEKQKEESEKLALSGNSSSTNSINNTQAMTGNINQMPHQGLNLHQFGNACSEETSNFNINSNQFANQFHSNNLQIQMAQIMALNSQNKYDKQQHFKPQQPQQQTHLPNSMVPNLNFNGEATNNRSVGPNLNTGLESPSPTNTGKRLINEQNNTNSTNSASNNNDPNNKPNPTRIGEEDNLEAQPGDICQTNLIPEVAGTPGFNDTSSNPVSHSEATAASSATAPGGQSTTGTPAEDLNRLQLLQQVYQQMGINSGNSNSGQQQQQQQQHPLLQQPMIEG
uniref:Zinc finger homeobox protein 3-like isoform X1 n=1 Tax=Hirondellea gigas TaxID=1518452 RepID=A0A6A7GAF5_9CRUS